MNILFAMELRFDAGSIQALANYARAGRRFGHTVAVYGAADARYPEIEFSLDPGAFNYVVFIFESKLHWLSGLRLARLLTTVPRSRRVILDADGMYNELVSLDGYDRNHASERDRRDWVDALSALADRVVQPTFWPRHPRAKTLLFYGYDPEAGVAQRHEKRVEVMHVAHNWWRWREVSERLLPAVERARGRLGDICFVGLWWDKSPEWAAAIEQQEAFRVDPDRLRELRIRTLPAVPYSDVIATMSGARVNIMTQRPLLRRLGLVTSKYFEIFTADTIPLLMIEPELAEAVYGPAGRELALTDDIEDKLVDALERPAKYGELVQAVREHLAAHHSYERRLNELLVMLAGNNRAESQGRRSCG